MLQNHIYTGDCIQVLREEIEPGSINLVFADPPYNIGATSKPLEWKSKKFSKVNESWDKHEPIIYREFTDKWVDACHTSLATNGTLFACCSKHNLSVVLSAIELKGFLVNNIITWFKTNAMPNMTGRVFTHSSEFIIYAVKGPGWVYNRKEAKLLNPEQTQQGLPKAMRDVWFIPKCSGKERILTPEGKAAHKTQKPEALVERCVRICSNPGDLVLDPFLGSGTTSVVAQRFNRPWIGIELDPTYVKMSQDRLTKLFPSVVANSVPDLGSHNGGPDGDITLKDSLDLGPTN